MINEIIVNRYELKKIENDIIDSNFICHNDWTKSCFDSIKENIINHLRIEQDNQCCYCKRTLGFDIKSVDIEHIIPKSRYEKFTFLPTNLALSCPGCNTKKSSENIVFKPIIKYPRTSRNVKIIHPYFDKYSEHIEILDGCIFSAKTKRGSQTITTCELFRLKVVEEKSKEVRNKNSMIHKLVEEIRNGEAEDGVLDELKQFLSLG